VTYSDDKSMERRVGGAKGGKILAKRKRGTKGTTGAVNHHNDAHNFIRVQKSVGGRAKAVASFRERQERKEWRSGFAAVIP